MPKKDFGTHIVSRCGKKASGKAVFEGNRAEKARRCTPRFHTLYGSFLCLCLLRRVHRPRRLRCGVPHRCELLRSGCLCISGLRRGPGGLLLLLGDALVLRPGGGLLLPPRVGSGKDRRTETRTRYFNVSGTYSQFFNDVLIEVSPKLSQKEFEKVGGFDTDNAVEYTSEYIAGHSSERYDTSVNDAYGTAKEKMNARIKSAILAQYHYDVVDYLHIDTSFNDSTFKYILVPLWCSGFKYRDKIYNYFVNGRTGKAGGKTPISVWKVALTVVIIAAVIVGAYFGLKSAGII